MSFPTLPPAPAQITIGRGGYVEVDPHLYVTTWNNQYVWDLTPYMTSIKVTHNPSRLNGQWILDAEITYEGWKYLRPFTDWLSPVLRVTYADGSVKQNQLGHCLVLDSPEHREEIGGTVRIDARDALWALNAQGFGNASYQPATGQFAPVGALVKAIVQSALVPGARADVIIPGPLPLERVDKFRHTLTPYFFDVGQDWILFDDGTRILEACNALLTGTNRVPLTTMNDGVLFTQQQGFINVFPPIRTWYANPPLTGPFPVGGISPLPNPPLADRLYSPIAQYVDTVPMTADLVDEVAIIGNISSSIVGRAKRSQDFTFHPPSVILGGGNVNPGLPIPPTPTVISDTSGVFGGVRKTIVLPGLTANQNAANYAATAILEALLTENTNATLFVEADPTFVSYYNTIDLAIWDANGDPIVNGRYVVNQVQYGFMPEDSLMRLEISKLPPYVPTFHASS